MAIGSWSVDIDYTPEVYAELVDDAGRPRKVHVRIYDSTFSLLYTGVQLTVTGDEHGLTIGGAGMLWWLGSGGIGPLILDRQYISSQDKLANGSFLLDDLYYRLAENTAWTFAGGTATHAAGLEIDDALQSDEKFPARPGEEYSLDVLGIAGTGLLWGRLVFEGEFTNTNQLINGGFEVTSGLLRGWEADSGTFTILASAEARSGNNVLRVLPVPRPVIYSGSWTGWSAASDISIVSGAGYDGADAMKVGPIPWPQLIANGTLEAGSTSWTILTPNNDIHILNNTGNAFEPTVNGYVARVGPVFQPDSIVNGTFDTNIASWNPTPVPTLPPAPGDWYHDTGASYEGAGSATTTGGGPANKHLAAANPIAVVPGERYRYQAKVRAGEDDLFNFDGEAHISLLFREANDLINGPWVESRHIKAGQGMAEQDWQDLFIEVEVPDDMHFVWPHLVVMDHTLGYWSFDSAKFLKIRDNTAEMASTAVAVEPDQDYFMSMMARSGTYMQGGDVSLRVKLTATGKTDMFFETRQGSTKKQGTIQTQWHQVGVSFRVPKNYVGAQAQLILVGRDIRADHFWVDLFKLEQSSNNFRRSTKTGLTLEADSLYHLETRVRSDADATRGTVVVGMVLHHASKPDLLREQSVSLTDNDYESVLVEVRPPAGYTSGELFVRGTDIDGGSFYVSPITVTKITNNTSTFTGTEMNLVPERTYRWRQWVKSTSGTEGSISLLAYMTAPGRPYVLQMSQAVTDTDGSWQLIEFDITPPSAYRTTLVEIVATDVWAGTFYVDDGSIIDTDTSTSVRHAWTLNPSGTVTLNIVAAEAPEGTEFVRAEVVAAASWVGSVGSMKLTQVGGPTTGNVIVNQLLTHPTLGQPMSVIAGTISCPETIPYDWRLLNMTARDALDHYCNVVSDPVREYRVNPNRTVDVGSNVFADWIPDGPSPVILLPEDIDVEALQNPETDATDRATQVRVIGATRTTVSGKRMVIETLAMVPGAAELDWNHTLVNRTKVVSDGTVDHFGYAQALADDLALKEATPPLALSATLTGLNTRPAFGVGDWIYVYDPDAGLEDTDYATEVDGQPVFPRRVRVLGRTRSLGPSHHIDIRRENGTTFSLDTMTGVRWSAEDSTTLTIGDRRPDWQADPAGRSR